MAFGREGIDYHDFPSYLDAWNVHMDWSNDFFIPEGVQFTTDPFKHKLLGEIGNDPPALKAFELFHQFRFFEFTDHCISGFGNMSQANADRFRELLFKAAPVINLVDGSEPWIRKIIDLAGGARNVYDNALRDSQASQFCFEMLFCVMVDTDGYPPERTKGCVISQACESMCSGIVETDLWPLAAKERELVRIVDLREDEGGFGSAGTFRTIWCTD
ncbi:MAG: hypothetical protein LBJ77_02010 [Holosporales bacterium]|jgi:hypothetical protein|nr:hypothetical protein [Holosporales bacterium]